MANSDLGHPNQPRLYRLKLSDSQPPQALLKTAESMDNTTTASSSCTNNTSSPNSSGAQQLQGNSKRHSSTLSTTVYDDLSGAVAQGGLFGCHAVTPVLVDLPAGQAGIILCHRAATDDGPKEENYATRRLPSPPSQKEQYVLLSQSNQ